METLYVLKAHFSSKNWKNAFLQKPPESVTTKKWESSEKRAVLNEKKQKIVNNGTVPGPNTLSEAPGDLRSRNLHPKSRPVASTFLVIRNQNWDLAFFRFFVFFSFPFFFWKNGAVFLCSWEYRDDDCGEKGKTEGKEESTSILIHLLTPDRPPLRPED